MIFTEAQISYEPDYREFENPSVDSHLFRVDLGDGRAGWARTARSLPRPSEEWVAQELTKQAQRLGAALEGRLVGPLGIVLRPPEADGS